MYSGTLSNKYILLSYFLVLTPTSAGRPSPLSFRKRGESIADFGVSSVERCAGVSPYINTNSSTTLFHSQYLKSRTMFFQLNPSLDTFVRPSFGGVGGGFRFLRVILLLERTTTRLNDCCRCVAGHFLFRCACSRFHHAYYTFRCRKSNFSGACFNFADAYSIFAFANSNFAVACFANAGVYFINSGGCFNFRGACTKNRGGFFTSP